jgi:hypothetical protein
VRAPLRAATALSISSWRKSGVTGSRRIEVIFPVYDSGAGKQSDVAFDWIWPMEESLPA